MSVKKLQKLREELEQLQQKQQQKAQQLRKERSRVTQRRRVVLGKFIEHQMEVDSSFAEKALRKLNSHLKSEQDRQLFDFPANDRQEVQDGQGRSPGGDQPVDHTTVLRAEGNGSTEPESR